MSSPTPINPIGTVVGNPIAPAGSTWLGGFWFEQLLPGSWRGVPFVMDSAPTKAGRRVAVHDYPFRDTVWAEDLGQLPRRFGMTAFLVGDDVYSQKFAMIAACEQLGPGTLVHPTLGPVQAVLLDFTTTDRRDRGRYVEVEFEFIEYSPTLFPTGVSNTNAAVSSNADDLNSAASSDLSNTLEDVTPVPSISTQFVDDYAQLAVDAVNDPARSLAATNGMDALNGRYAAGNMSTLQPDGTTVTDALDASVASRQDVLDAAGNLVGAAQAV